MASLVPKPNFFAYAKQQTDTKDLSLWMRPDPYSLREEGVATINYLFVGCELFECIVSLAVVRQTPLHYQLSCLPTTWLYLASSCGTTQHIMAI